MPQTVNLRYDSQTRLGRPSQFNEMNSALRLRLLKRADLAFADSVRALAGWNQTMEDWERFLSAEPDGCFLAEWNGASAGTATTTVYERELAWIGMVLTAATLLGLSSGLTVVVVNALGDTHGQDTTRHAQH